MSAHSEIGASAAYRWTVCPGSVGFIRRNKILNVTSEAAAEGTAAHELAADCLINGYAPDSRLGEIITVVCDATKREFEIEIDQEMIDGVNLYRQAIVELAEEVRDRPPTLCVLDFKYGAGVLVHVEGNKQLKQYALGALTNNKAGVEVNFDMTSIHKLMFGTADFVFANYRMDQYAYTPEYVRYGIVQPRCDHPDGPVRYHEVHASDLISYAQDLREAAEATDDPNAPLVPGALQCSWCPAAASCPALHEYRKKAALMLPWPVRGAASPEASAVQQAKTIPTVADVRPAFSMMSAEQIGERLRIVELAEVACKAMREHAYQEANRGVDIPGYKLVPKQARRKWLPSAEVHVERAIIERGLAGLIDMREPPKLRSPAQLEASIKEVTPLGTKATKGANKSLRDSLLLELSQHSEAKSSGNTLVPVSDSRAPVRLLTAKDIFKPVLKPVFKPVFKPVTPLTLPPISTAVLYPEEK